MSSLLDAPRAADLIRYVDENVRASGCDHSCRFTQAWANQHSVNFDDLADALNAQGAFCDCEVVLNLNPEPLFTVPQQRGAEPHNRWLIPAGFMPPENATTTKIVVSRAGVGKNTHTRDGEWLVPAPADAQPRKRMRKLTHFFIGIETGMPAEVGVVTAVPAISIRRFTQTVSQSAVGELQGFDQRIASYMAEKIARLPEGTTVGTDIMERVDISKKHRELTIHRVILRR